MTWVAEAFGPWYPSVYPHRDRAEAVQLASQLDGRIGLAGRRVVDIGCGTGRHLVPFDVLGARACGLDLSEHLLEEARRVRSESGAGWPLVRGDMRRLPFADAAFDVALSLFTSFGYFDEHEDREQLAEAARVVDSGGHHILDFLNRDQVLAHPTPETSRTSGEFRIDERRSFVGNDRRVVKAVRITRERTSEVVAEYEERVTLYADRELRDLLRDARLRVVEEWGDYEGGPFDASTSPRHVFLSVKE